MGGGGGSRRTIAGAFLTRLVDVLALALGAAFVLAVDAFFSATFVAVLSVFFGLPAVLVAAGLVALVTFYRELDEVVCESVGQATYLGSGFLVFTRGGGSLRGGFFLR